jgi:hypothetical protein
LVQGLLSTIFKLINLWMHSEKVAPNNRLKLTARLFLAVRPQLSRSVDME